MPSVYKQLDDIRKTLEKHYKDVQDIEFTIQKRQALDAADPQRQADRLRRRPHRRRPGRRGPDHRAGRALQQRRIPPDDLNQLLQPIFDPEAKAQRRPGQAARQGHQRRSRRRHGQNLFFADDAEASACTKHGPQGRFILVRRETSPEDLRGMQAAKGILTAFGGASSHAALVSRQMGKVCIVGCGALEIDYHKETVTVGGKTLKDGDWISIDGFTGEVYEGKVPTKPSEVVAGPHHQDQKARGIRNSTSGIAQLMSWVDKHRKLRVRTNADQPDQAAAAVAFGSEGIGLCRTEHMFFEHLDEIREMIVAETPRNREKALAKLLPFQRNDFAGLFRAMKGRPVTIRLLDPPLHEFLSDTTARAAGLAENWPKRWASRRKPSPTASKSCKN